MTDSVGSVSSLTMSTSHVAGQPHLDNMNLPTPSLPVPILTTSPLWSAALLAHQLSPICQFSREGVARSRETFQDWIKQLEMIASIGGWDECIKLLNLSTWLRGQAYAFYKSCPEQQWRNFPALVAKLTKRFIPVQQHAVQSGLFHDRSKQ